MNWEVGIDSVMSVTNWYLPRAFAICFCRDWIMYCCSCWPSTHPKRVQNGHYKWGPLCSRKLAGQAFLVVVVMHFVLLHAHVLSCIRLILCDPVDCSSSGSHVHGIFQARILEWVAISFSRGSSHVPCITGRFFLVWAIRDILRSQFYEPNSCISSYLELKTFTVMAAFCD